MVRPRGSGGVITVRDTFDAEVRALRAAEQEREQLAMAREIAEMHDTTKLLDDRGKTHGSFTDNAFYGQHLRDMFRGSQGWNSATFETREALEYVAGKLARILSGCPNEPQHWEDIAGYATLVVRSQEKLTGTDDPDWS